MVVWMEVCQGPAHDQGELNFVVQGHAAGAEDRSSAGRKDGGGRFQEKEGVSGSRVVQLFDVITRVR